MDTGLFLVRVGSLVLAGNILLVVSIVLVVCILKYPSFKAMLRINQFSSFSPPDCFEKNAFLWRHLAPKKVAPILNAPMDWRQKLMNCTTVSDGYFDTIWAFVGAL